MFKKRSNLIEQSIEKVILVVVGLGCVYILYEYVVRSPNKLKYDNQNFSAGQIDIYVQEQAEKLRERMNREPVAKPAYKPQSSLFLAKMDNTVSIDTNIAWPVPSAVEARIVKKYHIPLIGQVNDVELDYIRAAAYVPKVEITPENVNTETSYEPNDIDLVTIQGNFDMAGLVESFQQSFAGGELPEEWRDPVLAKPVFAAVGLQRQHLDVDGEWGNWEEVPRAKTDPHRADFKIIENVNGLPSGGVTVRLLKLGEPRMQASLLQPEPYQIASAEDEWLPPVLHKKFLTNQHEKETLERREAKAAEREEQRTEERDKTQRKTRPAKTTSPTAGASGRIAMEMEMAGGGGPPGGVQRSATRNPATERQRRPEQAAPVPEPSPKAPKATVEASINEEIAKISLAKKSISELREPIVFWAYDDTAVPGESYRYRVRLGVFNPVAGTGQIRAEDAAYDSNVILWSGFSDVTDAVVIPQRVYFFPVNVQEPAKAVDVQVSKYVLGYWYSGQFTVKRGEVIGRVAKPETPAQDKDKDKEKTKSNEKEAKLPEAIDYTTGAMVVDVVPVNDWFGDKNIQSRQYFNMLYSFDGTSIEQMAAKLMYWPEELRVKYSEIKTLEKKPRVAFRAWSNTGALGGLRISPGSPVGGGDDQQRMMEEMRMRMKGPAQ